MSLVCLCFSVGLIISTLACGVALCLPSLSPVLKYGKTLNDDFKSTGAGIFHNFLHWTVPKRWFYHFYEVLLLTVCCGAVLQGSWTTRCSLLLIQGVRRLLEEKMLFPVSSSNMHISHYLVGIFFYSAQGFGEYACDCKSRSSSPVAVVTFLAATVGQTVSHWALARTKKYNLPQFPLYLSGVCSPHYGFEILIYIALLILSPNCFLSYATLIWVSVSLVIAGTANAAFYRKRGRKVDYIMIRYIY